MTKTSLLLLISLLAFQPLHAQLDSLVDVFPLAVGNQWVYQYSMYSIDALAEIHTRDTGRVELRIYDRVPYSDSVAWRFRQQRNLVRRQGLFSPSGPPIQILDTATIELTERLDGQHQLYRNDPWVPAIPDVFPFSRFHIDTTGVYRYRLVDSTGCSTFLSRPPSVPGLNPRSLFTFERGVGEVRYQYNGGPFTGSIYNINHQLVGSVITEIDEPRLAEGLKQFALLQNYPNPFNPVTNFQFSIVNRQLTILKVYDVLGREIATLVNEMKPPGMHTVQWDATGVASGLYFYRLQAGDFVATKKLLYLK